MPLIAPDDPAHVAWLAGVLLSTALWALLVAALVRTERTLARLDRVEPLPPETGWPRLAVVVPARDEAAEVERALRTLLAQDYPDLEIVAIDDRSTDGTGAIMDRLAAEDPRLAVAHVESLPPGWLGKNHACHLGARQARGGWLLFTDGDVRFAADALRRAVSFATRHGLGHLVALPRLVAPGFWERAFQAAFGVLLNAKLRTWELSTPGTPGFAGVGAFNLVERAAYDRVGGHERLAMEVVDDLKLGLILRRSGVPQGAVDSAGLVEVRWNAGVVGSFRGLIKNAFAATEYRWSHVLLGGGVVAVLGLLPAAAALLAPLPALRVLALIPLAVSMAVHAAAARRLARGSGLEGLTFPACALALLAALVTSAAAVSLKAGVEWRGTRYPLEELRRGCVRERAWPHRKTAGW